MGFSYADDTQEEMDYGAIAKFAQDNLDLALGRGGDQVVVRSKNEETRFYGGKSNPLEKTYKSAFSHGFSSLRKPNCRSGSSNGYGTSISRYGLYWWMFRYSKNR